MRGLLQEPVHDLPWSGSLEDLFEMAKAKKSAAGGLDGWVWNRIKALPLAWFSGLAICSTWWSLLVSGQRG